MLSLTDLKRLFKLLVSDIEAIIESLEKFVPEPEPTPPQGGDT